jgi:hypothetical protein
MVVRDTPLNLLTSDTPPRPNDLASLAGNSRRCFSFSTGIINAIRSSICRTPFIDTALYLALSIWLSYYYTVPYG